MALVGLIGWIALGLLLLAWDGYVLSVVWGWFVASQFGLPVLTVAQAMGLALVAALLVPRRTRDPDETDGKRIFCAAAKPALVLGFAWIVRGFL